MSSISEQEWKVWRAFYSMRRQLDRAIDAQLHCDAGISAPDYEILLALSESPDKRLRSRDLAAVIGWERSRISHQVTRMEARKLVRRAECQDDLRGTWVELTPEGRRAILGAMRQHVSTIRELFFDVLTDHEKTALLSASERILERIKPVDCDEAERPVARG